MGPHPTRRPSRPVLLLFLSLTVPSGRTAPGQSKEVPVAVSPGDRKLSHEETLRWIADRRAWFRTRKTRPIWARSVEPDEVGKPFQTADHAIETARAGFWLSVGLAGEPWFQALEKIESKYEPAGTEVKRFPFDSTPRLYRIYRPRASATNWAAQVQDPGLAGFFIRASYDPEHPLYAPAGGYVVRNDVENPYTTPPTDVWLVQQALFESTYEVLP